MKHSKLFRLAKGLWLGSLFITACSTPANPARPLAPTPTPIPATSTMNSHTEVPVTSSSVIPLVGNEVPGLQCTSCRPDSSSSTGASQFCREGQEHYNKTKCILETPAPTPPPLLHGTDLDLTSERTPICDANCMIGWEKIVNESLGVNGEAYLSDALVGPWPAEIHGHWLNDNNWYPLDVYKQTLCGTLDHFNVHDTPGGGGEMDWNNYIIPSPPYMDLYDRAASHYRGEEPKFPPAYVKWHGDWFPCNGSECVDAEITPDQAFYENPWFPKGTERSRLEAPRPGEPGKAICTYGPWVRDEGHSNKPEIHPSELFWWKDVPKSSPGINTEEFWLMQIQDDSNRFDTDGDFDFGGWGSGPTGDWRPWAAAPRRNIFKIAFSLVPNRERIVFEIGQAYDRHVLTNRLSITEPLADDTGRNRHTITYNGEVVVEAYELQPRDEDITIEFVSISRNNEGTRLYGYLEIYTAVGKSNDGEEGYHVIYVDKTTVIPPLVPGLPASTQPPVTLPTYKSPNIVVSIEPRLDSLRRVVIGDQIQLLADVAIQLQAAADAKAEDLRVSQVNLVSSAKDIFRLPPTDTFVIDSQKRANLINIEGLPLFGSEELEFTLASGAIVHAGVGGIGFAPESAGETPLIIETTKSTWSGLASAVGADTIAAPPHIPLQHVSKWRLEVAPLYAGLKDGKPSPEDESRWSEELNRVLQMSEQIELERLFGSTQPITVSWEFEATNLNTGGEVPVIVNQAGPPISVRVELASAQEGAWVDATAQATFPKQSTDAIYRLRATATMNDTFGNTGTVEFEVWSEILPVESEEDVDEILGVVSNLVKAPEGLLLFASNITDLSDPNTDPMLNDPILRFGRMLRLYALNAARDQRITIGELEGLIRGVRLFNELK